MNEICTKLKFLSSCYKYRKGQVPNFKAIGQTQAELHIFTVEILDACIPLLQIWFYIQNYVPMLIVINSHQS